MVVLVLSSLSLVLVLCTVVIIFLFDSCVYKQKVPVRKHWMHEGSCCHRCGGSQSPLIQSYAGSVPVGDELHLWRDLCGVRRQLLESIKNIYRKVVSVQKLEHKREGIAKWLANLGSYFSTRISAQPRGYGNLSCGSPMPMLELQKSSSKSNMINFQAGCRLEGLSTPGKNKASSCPANSLATANSTDLPMHTVTQVDSLSNKNILDTRSARLVLEILMSSDMGAEVQSCSPSSSSGLRLRLETNSNLGHLASLSSSQTQYACGKGMEGTDVARLPVDVIPDALGNMNLVTSRMIATESNASQKSGSVCHAECLPVSTARLDNSRRYAQATEALLPTECPSSAMPDAGELKHMAHNGTIWVSTSNPPVISHGELDLKATIKEVCFIHGERPPAHSMNDLGALQLMLLKDDTLRPSRDVGSMMHAPCGLAALNVRSSPSDTDSSFSDDLPNGVAKSLHGTTTSRSIFPQRTLQEDLIDSSGAAVKELLEAASCGAVNGDKSVKKKEKKKRKNKVKKQNGTLRSSVVDKASEGWKVNRGSEAISQREMGCACGAQKGSPCSNICLYPFTSSGSMLQRRIKEQYDELMKSNLSNSLTLSQVGRFTACLVEAKASLQQKSDSIQRRFTIAKSLLSKADKSSFDRICGQIYSLEMEQKKLEEDTLVYNRLQEQLKLSPAYNKMLEYGRAHIELQSHKGQRIEKFEPEESELSFEELLAQEKKDSFWKKHSLRQSS